MITVSFQYLHSIISTISYKNFIQMQKQTFILLCLLGVALTLRFSHLDDAAPAPATDPVPASDPAQPSTPVPPPRAKSPQEKAAEGRLFAFVASDPELLGAMMSGTPPTSDQLKKLMNFMLDDKFYQMQMIKDISSQPQNKWMKSFSKAAQIRFFKIVTSVDMDKLDDEATQKEIITKLYADKDIGKVLRKKFGEAPPADFLSSTSNGLQSGLSAATHHLAARL